jgi:putative heme-binding domain-containing protein
MAVAILSSVRDDAAVLLTELASEDSALGSNGPSLMTQLMKMAERQSSASSESSTDTGEPARELGEMATVPPSARRDREKIVESYAAALTLEGDTTRGHVHFTKHCRVCHQPDGSGQALGPSVDSLKLKGASVLLTSILDPNREVNPQYLNHVLVLHDGRVSSGMIADEGANSVTLRRADGMIETVLRIDIEAMRGTGLSIMPEGFEQSLDPQAMADLLAYLLDAR